MLGVHAVFKRFPVKYSKLLVGLFTVAIVFKTFTAVASASMPEYVELFQITRHLKQGTCGEDVERLQNLLADLGYYDVNVDGIFGSKTKSAVQNFQTNSGLIADGIVGPATSQILESELVRLYPPLKHIVAAGETLSTIATEYGLSTSYLISINSLKNPDRIFPGDIVILKADEQNGLANKTETVDLPEEVVLPFTENLFFPDKRICLTFNDGPDPTSTPAILEILNEYGIKATFFVIGEKARKYPELIKQIEEEGHVIGIHGYYHKVLAGLSSREIQTELEMAQTCVTKATGQKPYLYRPPYGILDKVQVDEARKLGMTVLMWTNIGGADLGARSSKEVLERVLSSARDGGVILLHEGLSYSVEALSAIIPSLAQLGFGFQNPSSASIIESAPSS